jgi:hypothetical protein
MSETETEQGARGEEDEPGPLQGSATEHQHSFEAGVMGLTHCDAEIGDISIEATTAWDAIAYGGTLTIRCVECDQAVRVRLTVVESAN